MNRKIYKFRIYPTKRQSAELQRHLEVSKNLWNKLLEHTIQKYDSEKKFLSWMELYGLVKKSSIYSQTALAVTNRLRVALKAKVRAKKKGIKWGFPRFKSIDRMKSLHYPQSGFSLKDKKLKVTPFGEINIKKHREIEGTIKNLTLKRESTGKWFACFCVEETPKEPKINNGSQVGIDVGIINLATLSNGERIENPHQFKKFEKELAEAQRQLSRKKKGSANRLKAKYKVASIYEKIVNVRRDFLHKQTNDLVSKYSLIALEKLDVPNMLTPHKEINKSISDVSWSLFANMLSYKAESAGSKVVFVNPKNTSKMCSRCGTLVDKPIIERVHNCHNCGLSIDRDWNAALNILQKATVGQTGSNACEVEPIGSTMKQEAQTRVCHKPSKKRSFLNDEILNNNR
jgi:putative transposase